MCSPPVRHVGHVGWDPNNIDPDMWKLLSQAGISADAMNDEQTSQMVLNVIEQSGGMEAVKREMNRGISLRLTQITLKLLEMSDCKGIH